MLNGEKELKEIIPDDKKHNIVYNLKLDNEHVYYVNGYLVHNAKNVTDDELFVDPIGPVDAESPVGGTGGTKPLPTGGILKNNGKRR